MSGYNCEKTDWPELEEWETSEQPTAVVDSGFLIRKKATETKPAQMVTRPSRGSGGLSLWSDRRRAERECDEDEEVVEVVLRLEVVR